MNNKKIFISGAGPVGLSAGLFLVEKGIMPIIIEKLKDPTPFSKAFGVNSRTLTLLEPSGATDLFLKNGRKMPAINIYRNYNLLIRNEFASAKHKYPFMLIQSQADSESILEKLLLKKGIEVIRNTELKEIKSENKSLKLSASFDHKINKEYEADILLAADGAHSFIRKNLNMGFDGSAFEEEWKLYDIELESPFDTEEAHAFILDQGALFMIRIQETIWRIISNISGILNQLPKNIYLGKTYWESAFSISHRLISSFKNGNVFFAGDAAHIHSGLGARGMNMGIEDAYVFAKLLGENKLDEYDTFRKKEVSRMIGYVTTMTDLARGKTFKSRLFRKVAPLILPGVFPLVKKQVQSFVLGIDHEV